MAPVVVASREELLDRANAERARRSLRAFYALAWTIVEPGRPYIANWHIDAIAEHLEAITSGQITRLVVSMPPGYMKSRAITVMWPCWEWIRNPSLRYLCASYAESLAVDHNVERRNIIESPWYQRHWGDRVQLEDDDNQKVQFTNTARGRMIASGVGGTATGKGGERLICDDPLNPKQAASDAERLAAEKWFLQTFSTRLRDKQNGAIVVVMQRLHQRDVAAIALELGYDHLCLPAEYDPARSTVTSIGWKDPRKIKGELLWPEREGPAEIAAAKRALGSAGYAGQYGQNPQPDGGDVFKKEHFRYYRPEPGEILDCGDGFRVHLRQLHLWTTNDLGFSKKEKADYTASAVWGFGAGRLFLLDLFRERATPTELDAAMKAAEARWGVRVHWVEEGAFKIGAGTIRELRARGRPISVLGAEHGASRDKHQRAVDTGPRFEAGDVWFPHFAAWLSEFEAELLVFPNGDHDDQVDIVSYACAVAPWGGPGIEFSSKRTDEPAHGLNRPRGW